MSFLKSAYAILVGLLALIFVYSLKLLFVVSSIIALVVIGRSSYFILMCFILQSGGDVYVLQHITLALFSVGYLCLTNALGVGMTDIIKLANLVFGFMGKSSHKKHESSRMGEKGVFKR